jgi:hypothetical protein
MSDPARPPTTRLRLFLRDFRMLEADIVLNEGQSLRSYLANRQVYVNLRRARWASTGAQADHAVLKVEQVLWGASPDGDVPLVNASQPRQPRMVELQLDGGLLIRAGLNMGEPQRLSDYLEAAGSFIPLHDAHLLQSGRPPRKVNVTLGDIVLNQAAIQAVWEVTSGAPGGAEAPSHLADAEVVAGGGDDARLGDRTPPAALDADGHA